MRGGGRTLTVDAQGVGARFFAVVRLDHAHADLESGIALLELVYGFVAPVVSEEEIATGRHCPRQQQSGRRIHYF